MKLNLKSIIVFFALYSLSSCGVKTKDDKDFAKSGSEMTATRSVVADAVKVQVKPFQAVAKNLDKVVRTVTQHLRYSVSGDLGARGNYFFTNYGDEFFNQLNLYFDKGSFSIENNGFFEFNYDAQANRGYSISVTGDYRDGIVSQTKIFGIKDGHQYLLIEKAGDKFVLNYSEYLKFIFGDDYDVVKIGSSLQISYDENSRIVIIQKLDDAPLTYTIGKELQIHITDLYLAFNRRGLISESAAVDIVITGLNNSNFVGSINKNELMLNYSKIDDNQNVNIEYKIDWSL